MRCNKFPSKPRHAGPAALIGLHFSFSGNFWETAAEGMPDDLRVASTACVQRREGLPPNEFAAQLREVMRSACRKRVLVATDVGLNSLCSSCVCGIGDLGKQVCWSPKLRIMQGFGLKMQQKNNCTTHSGKCRELVFMHSVPFVTETFKQD